MKIEVRQGCWRVKSIPIPVGKLPFYRYLLLVLHFSENDYSRSFHDPIIDREERGRLDAE